MPNLLNQEYSNYLGSNAKNHKYNSKNPSIKSILGHKISTHIFETILKRSYGRYDAY